MDKLEPVIRHKFWIIFGLTLPVALFAYYSASGKMSEATTQQETRLDTALNGIPSGTSEPNDTYSQGADKVNADLNARFAVQVQRLWELQTDRMTWPKVVVDFIPDMYQGEIERKARYTYMRVYKDVIERLWERVQPYVGEQQNNPALLGINVDWPQKVIIDGHAIPHANFNMSLPADNKDIWDAQEDIWLLELIFDAVVRTNKDANFVSESPVRQIDKVQLVGGSGQSSVTAPAAASGSSGDDSYGDMAGIYNETYGAMGAGAAGKMGAAQVAFNVAEEFGAQVPEASATTESASTASSEGSYGDLAGIMGGGYGGAQQKFQRYIGAAGVDPFTNAYRERGFYMSVIILQDRIPDFFAELSSSPWPIRIGRFHVGPNPYATKAMPSSGSGRGYGQMTGFGGGYGGGFAGGSEMFTEESSYGATSGYGGGGFGGGYGQFGGNSASTLKLPAYMKMPTSIDPQLRASPDLVQVDFCGIITMYNPVTSRSVEVIDDGSTEADFQETLESSPETPEAAQQQMQEEAAAAAAAPPAAEGAAPAPAPAEATESAPAPAPDPAAPTDSATQPPATEPPVTEPPATPNQ